MSGRDIIVIGASVGGIEPLKQLVRASMADGGAPQELTLQATNRRGKQIRLKVAISPLSMNGERKGAILLISELHDAQA